MATTISGGTKGLPRLWNLGASDVPHRPESGYESYVHLAEVFQRRYINDIKIRDGYMYEAYKNGADVALLARKVGITRRGVYDILRRQGVNFGADHDYSREPNSRTKKSNRRVSRSESSGA